MGDPVQGAVFDRQGRRAVLTEIPRRDNSVKGLPGSRHLSGRLWPPQIMEALQYGRHIGDGRIFRHSPSSCPEVPKTLEAGASFKFDNVHFDGGRLPCKGLHLPNQMWNFITLATGRYPQTGTF